jgi:ribosomal protein L22
MSQALAHLAQQAQDLGANLPALAEAIAALQANQTDLLLKDLDAALNDLDKLKNLAQAMQQLQHLSAKLGRNLAEQLENGQAQAAQMTLEKMIQQLRAAPLSPDDLKKMLDEVRQAVDHDGKISLSEAKTAKMADFFNAYDANKDGFIERQEWDGMRNIALKGKNALLAIRPGGRGDITDTHVAWTATKGLPYVASPLYYQGRIYLVKDGGILSCYEAKTGREIFVQERLEAAGSYYASPVAADGKVYCASLKGVVTVLEAGDKFKVLARNDFKERLGATPALVGEQIYLRTDQHLYAIGRREPKR